MVIRRGICQVQLVRETCGAMNSCEGRRYNPVVKVSLLCTKEQEGGVLATQ